MSLTSSLYTSLSGLTSNAQLISVAGNNIANVNTTGFKASRMNFETTLSETLATGSAPTGNLGGTNPIQIGLGTQVAANTHDFTDGSLQNTGVNSNLAIQGNGFFVVNDNGQTLYTRAGNFQLDNSSNLVDPSGAVVQGYGVDQDFNVLSTGTPQAITIPVNDLTLAVATKNVDFTGNLNSNGSVAVNGSALASNPLYADATQTTPADTTTSLTSLFDGSGTQLMTDGDVLTLSGATKNGATLPPATFQVGATNTTNSDANGTTLGDLTNFLQGTLGIDTTGSGSPGTTPGVTVSNGAIQINGNTGTVNDLDLTAATITDNGNTATPVDLTFTKSQSADGESVATSFIAYDSLGSPMTLNLSAVLDNKSASGTTWQFYVSSQDGSGPTTALGNGTLNFDTSGQLTAATGNVLSIPTGNIAAASPQKITLNFDQPSGALTSLADTSSQIAAANQDGTAKGTLDDFSVNSDGTIVGTFSNSQTRTLGQVVLAKFANPDGLLDAGNNHLAVTAASGDAAIATPGDDGAGQITGGALEQSNVDISQEFINLITASTGFSANSRVLTTSDQMLQELLANTQI